MGARLGNGHYYHLNFVHFSVLIGLYSSWERRYFYRDRYVSFPTPFKQGTEI